MRTGHFAANNLLRSAIGRKLAGACHLTSDRVNRLHDLGFADPGRGPNYWKNYATEQIDDASIARELLTVLHDVYGYNGQPTLKVKTEEAH